MLVKYDYEKFTLDDILSGKKIIVPPFQRNVVWNEKKRKEFIQTLRAGNPFGSILVHKDGDKYTLIDGLQRVSTIKDFSINPYKYFSYLDINENLVFELIKNDFESKNIFYSKTDSVVIKRCEEIQKFIFDEISDKKDWNDIFYPACIGDVSSAERRRRKKIERKVGYGSGCRKKRSSAIHPLAAMCVSGYNKDCSIGEKRCRTDSRSN